MIAAQQPRRPSEGEFFPQINTLRAIAVSLVLGAHWISPLMDRLGIDGSYGVWLFFTISGFLITDILLRYRDTVETGGATRSRALWVFYMRRFVRILPAYYLLLIVAWFVGRLTIENGPWHFAYLSNVYFLRKGHFETLGHLWSLAVEEQFYLFWPLLVLAVPNRTLPWVIVAGMAVAVVFRVASVMLDWGLAGYVMPVACFDTLGTGALLAWLRHNQRTIAVQRLVAAGLFALLLLPFMGFAPPAWKSVLAPGIVAGASVFLLGRCIKGVGGIVGRLLSLRPLLYIGTISYGIYLYHAIAAWIVPDHAASSLGSGTSAMIAIAAIRTVVVLALAAASWHLFERPMNRLKSRWTLGVPEGKKTRNSMVDPTLVAQTPEGVAP